MPDVDGAEYLIALWFDAGTVCKLGQGLSSLTWQEIDSWLTVRRLRNEPQLSPWEIETVQALSVAYANQYHSSSTKGCPAPYCMVEEESLDRVAVGSKIANVLRGLKTVK